MSIHPKEINHQKLSWLLEQPIDVKISILSQHLEIVRLLINEILEEDVKRLTGAPYDRSRPHDGRYQRWGYNPGSVKVNGHKIPINVPRVYDQVDQKHIPLESYEKLKSLDLSNEQIVKAILLGISTRDAKGVLTQLDDSFGLSHSTISQQFVAYSEEQLRFFLERDLRSYEFIALFIDGKYLMKEQMVIVLGVTLDGQKMPLGFIQTHTENAVSIGELLRNLTVRGLRYPSGLLTVIDGGKGISKAVLDVFGHYVVIQRCQWHKRENVVSYLAEMDQETYRRRLNHAYQSLTYDHAKEQLTAIYQELMIKNQSAARSLLEGQEETLTLHRLGLAALFGPSFSTTNCIENLNSQVEKYVRKIKRWNNSNQRHRWIACALLESETKMRKVNNYKKLSILKEKITFEVEKNLKKSTEKIDHK